MKQLLLPAIAALLLACGACADDAAGFKGRWEHSVSDEESVEEYVLLLDPAGKNVNFDGYEGAAGVIRSHVDLGGFEGTTSAEIIEFEARGNTAHIKYRHAETGEIHRAELTLDPAGEELRWEYRGLYKTGANTPKEYAASDFENPMYLEPNDAKLTKTGDFPD